jgi:polysaccharide biosynthesis protein PelF
MKKTTLPESAPADICLILEGTYPYTMGGVAGWTHELIQMHSNLTFSIVALISATTPTELAYKLPSNVVSLKTLRLQSLPKDKAALSRSKASALLASIEQPLLRLQSRANLNDLAAIIAAIEPWRHRIGQSLLLDSRPAWKLLLRMYQATMPKCSFLDYFWSWRGLFGGLFSILLTDLPPARAYHGLCTGYAGLLLARAHLETGRPCIVTEHGIYSNERRIEIASADWLDDPHVFNLGISLNANERELKDFWIDTFTNYSRLCYEACRQVITLYEGNQEFQRMDGADPAKMRVIPNGIDTARYDHITRPPHPPTVALIGRVVPIKDIKTYIKAVGMLKAALPELRAYMLGPSDEDPLYAAECMEMVEHLGLGDTLFFPGKVNTIDYLGGIDVLVLTSISEAQPLVILEAGAAGIPTVATDVGACREMILGGNREQPPLGPGGAVVPLSSPKAVANALLMLLSEPDYYRKCSQAIAARVRRYYCKEDQYTAYAGLYDELIASEDGGEPLEQEAA